LWSANDRPSRRLADDGRHFTDPAVRFAGIFIGILNAAPVVIFSVAQQPVEGTEVPHAARLGRQRSRQVHLPSHRR